MDANNKVISEPSIQHDENSVESGEIVRSCGHTTQINIRSDKLKRKRHTTKNNIPQEDTSIEIPQMNVNIEDSDITSTAGYNDDINNLTTKICVGLSNCHKRWQKIQNDMEEHRNLVDKITVYYVELRRKTYQNFLDKQWRKIQNDIDEHRKLVHETTTHYTEWRRKMLADWSMSATRETNTDASCKRHKPN